VQDTITGEHLQDLLRTETWRDLFISLSESLGFSLSVHSSTGQPIFTALGNAPLCQGFHLASPQFESQCNATCRSYFTKALATGKPEVYQCYAKIMSFVLPIEYMGEKAVIQGQGSFPSYDDFRACMDLASTYGIDMVTIKIPITFTDEQQAWKTCRIVAGTVNRLLKNLQETTILRRQIESLKSIFSRWGTSSVQQPEMGYQDMLYNLSTLLNIDRITILGLDRERGVYASLYGLSKQGAPMKAVKIDAQHAVVKELKGGKTFVHALEAGVETASQARDGRSSRFFFPIFINDELAGILRIVGQPLTESDIQTISGFCKQTALFIENQQLHRALNKKFDQYIAISELTKGLAPIQNYGTLLQTILDKSAELLKAEQGSLMLIDHDTDALLLEAKKGIVEGVSAKLRISRGEGIAGKVAEIGEPFLVKDVEQDPRTNQKNRQHYKTSSFVSVPLKIDNRIIGVLNLSDKTSGEVFDEDDLTLIQTFATHAALVMERNVFFNQTEELKKLTITDSLTGLLNRRYLYERLKIEIARAERTSHQLSLLMVDLDGFKACNDSLGHIFGDKILKSVAETLFNTVRTMDIVSRYGGDEFMIILPETGESLASEIADRVRSNVINNVPLPQDGDSTKPHSITASIGIVCYPDHGTSVELLLENVDKALYRAKKSGRNRVEVFS
jgi:diguanylate cyclase (GGDEF)-like protein